MILLRSLLFNIVFYVNLILFLVLGSPLFLGPRKAAIRGLQLWAKTSLWWLRVICKTKMEVRGQEYLRSGPLLVAGKHQSLWETFAVLPLFDDPCIVLKRELTWIPLFGWYIPKFCMMSVSREAGAGAIRRLVVEGKEAMAQGRQVIILPEGTRQAVDAPPNYKPGAAALYGALESDCLPFALNAGLFWPRRKFLRYPGTIIIEFLPPIPAGLPRRIFQARLQSDIETATARLVIEARQTPDKPSRYE